MNHSNLSKPKGNRAMYYVASNECNQNTKNDIYTIMLRIFYFNIKLLFSLI